MAFQDLKSRKDYPSFLYETPAMPVIQKYLSTVEENEYYGVVVIFVRAEGVDGGEGRSGFEWQRAPWTGLSAIHPRSRTGRPARMSEELYIPPLPVLFGNWEIWVYSLAGDFKKRDKWYVAR